MLGRKLSFKKLSVLLGLAGIQINDSQYIPLIWAELTALTRTVYGVVARLKFDGSRTQCPAPHVALDMIALAPLASLLIQVPNEFLDLDYRVRVAVADPSEELVFLDAELSGLTGPLELGFLEGSSFVTIEPRLHQVPRAMDAMGNELSMERLDGFSWRLDPEGAERVFLDWAIRLDHRRHPDVVGRDGYEQPYLNADHGLLTCATTMLVPRLEYLEDSLSSKVSFALPPAWAVETPWPEPSQNVFVPPDGAALSGDLIAIGGWDRHRDIVGGVDLSVLFAPGQADLKTAIAEPLARIVSAELELFGVTPHERYLFLFVEPEDSMGYGGSAKPNSMALFMSEDLPVSFARDGLRHLLAHEYHHSWMLSRCQPEDELRFVIEGFTDWYAAVVPWQIGETNDEAFHNRVLQQLGRADTALAELEGSLAAAGGNPFFAGGPAYDACYAAGFGLAAWTELALRQADAGYGLDELMRRFYNDARWDGGDRPSADDWFALLAEGVGEDLAALQRAVVEGAEPFDWVTLFGRVGLEIAREVERLELSPKANFEGNRVTAIDPSGAGYLIGLRQGDALLEVGGRPVLDERTARGNWRPDAAGRIELVVERAGQRLELAGEYPSQTVYRLPEQAPARPWG